MRDPRLMEEQIYTKWVARFCLCRKEFSSYVPRQQISNLIDRIVGNMREHIAQISFWINVIHPRRANQTIHSSGTIAPTIRAQKQEVLAANATTPQRILGDVVINLGHAIFTVIN